MLFIHREWRFAKDEGIGEEKEKGAECGKEKNALSPENLRRKKCN